MSARMRVNAAADAAKVPRRSLFRAVQSGIVPSLPDEDGVATIKLADVEAWAANRKSAARVPAGGSGPTPAEFSPEPEVGAVPVAAPALALVPGDAVLVRSDAAVDRHDVTGGAQLGMASGTVAPDLDERITRHPAVQELAAHFFRVEDGFVTLSSAFTRAQNALEHVRAENAQLAGRVLVLEQTLALLTHFLR